jgi:hypothetical protein
LVGAVRLWNAVWVVVVVAVFQKTLQNATPMPMSTGMGVVLPQTEGGSVE